MRASMREEGRWYDAKVLAQEKPSGLDYRGRTDRQTILLVDRWFV